MPNAEMFGRGHAHYEGIDFSTAPMEDIAVYLGFMAGCPNPWELIVKRGAKVMALRYGEILSQYGIIIEQTRKVLPAVAGEIDSLRLRSPDEPLAHFEKDHVPPDYINKWIPPTEGMVGYALPRMKIAYVRSTESGLPTANRVYQATRLYSETLNLIKPNTAFAKEKVLLVTYAEKLSYDGTVDPLVILRNLISAGKLKQDSFLSDFTDVVGFMPEHAPKLFDVYYRLSENERAEANIAHIRI